MANNQLNPNLKYQDAINCNGVFIIDGDIYTFSQIKDYVELLKDRFIEYRLVGLGISHCDLQWYKSEDFQSEAMKRINDMTILQIHDEYCVEFLHLLPEEIASFRSNNRISYN